MIVRRISDSLTWEWGSAFKELERMRRQMNRLAEELTEGIYREPVAGVFPLLNVTEDKDKYYVRAELPGIKGNDLDISVTGNTLSISGERKIAAEGEKIQYHRKERESGEFNRMISLPAQVDTAQVEAHCADGILTVVLPKSEAAKPTQITVKTP